MTVRNQLKFHSSIVYHFVLFQELYSMYDLLYFRLFLPGSQLDQQSDRPWTWTWTWTHQLREATTYYQSHPWQLPVNTSNFRYNHSSWLRFSVNRCVERFNRSFSLTKTTTQ